MRGQVSITNDDIKDRIADLLTKKIGDPFSDEDINKICKEGDVRYKNRIPPGYKDQNKSSNSESIANTRRIYGDLLIWKQLIEKAATSQKDLIFITNDKKDDWWEIQSGKTIGPRPELTEEFLANSKHNILMYQADSFMVYASQKYKQEIEKDIVEEIKNTKSSEHRDNRKIALEPNRSTISKLNNKLKSFRHKINIVQSDIYELEDFIANESVYATDNESQIRRRNMEEKLAILHTQLSRLQDQMEHAKSKKIQYESDMHKNEIFALFGEKFRDHINNKR